ncbi:hypothetical protein VKT23_018154 [Stygiomarasmius scandens]|uniref:Peptidase metallopeptidase domain-containing protein n=1 Tax=Marasmiellus scandens TaxID=2682957 RepID=A0ABR1ISG2_9AGAR
MAQSIGLNGKACSPAPVIPSSTDDGLHAVMSKKLWDMQQGSAVVLTYAFLDGTANQQSAVTNTIPIWLKYANVSFDHTSTKTSANIRISFTGPGSWSYVGTDATNVDKSQPTMNLGWLADANPPSKEDAATILHEFGHALGMMHEHQSPARGQCIHLKELEVYNYYRPLLQFNDALVKSQVIDVYFMPASLNEENVEIPVNLVLSSLDKAFITLNYPGQTPVGDDGMSALDALNVAGVPENSQTSVDILTFISAQDYPSARQAFIDWNKSVVDLTSVNTTLVGASTGPARDIMPGIVETVIQAANNSPLFQSIVKNIVNQIFVKRAIPTQASVPGSSDRDIVETLAALVVNPAFAQTIHDVDNVFLPQA